LTVLHSRYVKDLTVNCETQSNINFYSLVLLTEGLLFWLILELLRQLLSKRLVARLLLLPTYT